MSQDTQRSAQQPAIAAAAAWCTALSCLIRQRGPARRSLSSLIAVAALAMRRWRVEASRCCLALSWTHTMGNPSADGQGARTAEMTWSGSPRRLPGRRMISMKPGSLPVAQVRNCASSLRERGSTEDRSEEHTSELQSHSDLVCRLLLEKKKQQPIMLLA